MEGGSKVNENRFITISKHQLQHGGYVYEVVDTESGIVYLQNIRYHQTQSPALAWATLCKRDGNVISVSDEVINALKQLVVDLGYKANGGSGETSWSLLEVSQQNNCSKKAIKLIETWYTNRM